MNWKFSDVSKRCYSYQWWSNYIGDKHRVNLSPNTFVEKENSGLIKFYLFGNNILTVSWQNHWQLSSRGWETHTTKKRLNQLGPLNIYQKDWVWYYEDENGVTQLFEDAMIVDCNGRRQESLCWTKLKL